MRLFVFGLGYVGAAFADALQDRGWDIAASARDPGQAQALRDKGITPADPADRDAMIAALAGVNAILITAPPGPDGCPALESIVPALAQAQAYPDWIGYLSTTGVYGDFEGRWVFETSPLKAQSVEGARRVGAERDWRQVGRGMGLTVTTFRLPGIYGPGRSALDRLRAGEGRRIVKPGQVFSRIHVDDIVSGLLASLDHPRAGGVTISSTTNRPRPRTSWSTPPGCWAFRFRRTCRSTNWARRRRHGGSTPRTSASRTLAPRRSWAGGPSIRPTAKVWRRS